MIDLSQYPILKDDLTAGVTNAEYLVSIDSGSTQHPNIYIGTKKQTMINKLDDVVWKKVRNKLG